MVHDGTANATRVYNTFIIYSRWIRYARSVIQQYNTQHKYCQSYTRRDNAFVNNIITHRVRFCRSRN